VKIASAFRTRLKMMGAFAQTPAVVAAFDDEIDLFPFVLADVPGPHIASVAVPTESPGIAQAVCPDFLAHAILVKLRFGGEWIIERNAIRESVGDPGCGFG